MRYRGEKRGDGKGKGREVGVCRSITDLKKGEEWANPDSLNGRGLRELYLPSMQRSHMCNGSHANKTMFCKIAHLCDSEQPLSVAYYQFHLPQLFTVQPSAGLHFTFGECTLLQHWEGGSKGILLYLRLESGVICSKNTSGANFSITAANL